MAAPSGLARSAMMRIEGLPELERKLAELARLSTSPMTALVGTDITDPPYPYFLEYGTSRMPAYPAARPAFDERYPEAVRTAGIVIGRLIAAGRYGPDVPKAGLEAGAFPIANRWKELARYRTGTYRRSVFIDVVEGDV